MGKAARKIERPQRQEGLKADYRGATPEQVARAVLTYRPDGKPKPEPKSRPVTVG